MRKMNSDFKNLYTQYIETTISALQNISHKYTPLVFTIENFLFVDSLKIGNNNGICF